MLIPNHSWVGRCRRTRRTVLLHLVANRVGGGDVEWDQWWFSSVPRGGRGNYRGCCRAARRVRVHFLGMGKHLYLWITIRVLAPLCGCECPVMRGVLLPCISCAGLINNIDTSITRITPISPHSGAHHATVTLAKPPAPPHLLATPPTVHT